MSSAAVVIGALRVKWLLDSKSEKKFFMTYLNKNNQLPMKAKS